MDRIVDLCKQYNIVLIEDCAHTMGASWKGKKSGSFGDVACFSTQTYKHINSGEGGFLITPHDDMMARAIMYSGSYMLFDRHQAAPPKSAFDSIRYETPNYSGRMDNLRAAILRPQLADLETQCQRWNQSYQTLEQILNNCSHISIPKRPAEEEFVASSIQFSVPAFSAEQIPTLVKECQARGVIIKWFGASEPQDYTSRYDSWRYIEQMPYLPKTERVLSTLLDMRIPLTFSHQDCELIAEIIVEVVDEIVDAVVV
jgi:dTDP-4-amino-4,6-dideoxygalactose transaminase